MIALAVSLASIGSAGAQTLQFPGPAVDIGSDTRIIDGVLVANGATGVIVGDGGTLIHQGGDFRIGGTASNTVQNLDMSGLSNYVFDGAGAVFSASGQATGGAANTTGVSNTLVNLAAGTNVITAARFGVADTTRNVQGRATNQGTVRLGQTNFINADAITIGVNQTNGTLNFQDGIIDGTVKLRGTDGTSAVANWNIADGSNSNYSAAVGLADFSAGVLDAKVDNLTIATSVFGTNPASGTLNIGRGVLDADTILLGQRSSTSGAGNTTANLVVGTGGTVLANAITVGNRTGTTGAVTADIKLSGGTVRAGSILAGVGAATRSVTFDDGVLGNLAEDQAMTVNVPIVLAATGTHTLQVDGSTALMTVSGRVSGVGGTLTKAGDGVLALTGTNTYSGTTTVNEGLIRFQTGANLGTGRIVLDGGGLQWASGNTTDISARLDALGTRGAVLDTNGNAITLATGMNGDGGQLVKRGDGTLTLTGNSTHTGTTWIEQGDLVLGNGGTSGNLTGNIVNNTRLTINRSDRMELAGDIAGSGVLVQAGTGTTVLTGTGVHSGGTRVDAGNLQLGNGGSSGNLVGNVALAAGTSLGVDRSDTFLLGANISGAGALVQRGSGSTVLGSNQAYTGGTAITGGTLQLGNGGSTGQVIGAIQNDGVLAFNFDRATIDNTITGSGSLLQAGNGRTVLTTDSAHTGGTRIAAGTLQLGDGGTRGSVSGAIANDGALAIVRSDTYQLDGVVSGSGSLAQSGTGTTVLTADNTYTGPTLITAGTLQLGDGGNSGGVRGDVRNDAALVVDRADQLTLAGNLSGSGTLQMRGSGTLVLAGDTTHSGGTFVDNGGLQIGDGGTRGTLAGNVRVATGTRIAFNRADTVLFDGQVAGDGALEQRGAGTTVLERDQAHTGGTRISAGALRLGNGGTTGSVLGAIDVDAAGTVEFNRSDDITLTNAVRGSGGLVQLGQGTLRIGDDQSYTGATRVAAGTLQVDGSILSNTAVDAGAILGGGGSIHGDVLNAGTLRPGSGDDYGTLTVHGNYVGDNGRVLFNTYLGDDSAPSSLLVIDGGNASGNTDVLVRNANSIEGHTVGNGILVIAATNGGTTERDAFRLGNYARNGALSYELFRGDVDGLHADNWYLRNSFIVPLPVPVVDPVDPIDPIDPIDPVDPVDPVDPIDPVDPVDPIDQGDGETAPIIPTDPIDPDKPLIPGTYPIIGRELATYGVIQPIARELGLLTLGTLRERTGASSTTQDQNGRSAWIRATTRHLDNGYQSFVSPNAKGELSTLQIGSDLWQKATDNGTNIRLGGYMAHGRSNLDVRGVFTNDDRTGYVRGDAGKVDLRATSAGLSWTQIGERGGYLDAVVQATRYTGSALAGPVRLPTHGEGYIASLETGYPFTLPMANSTFVLEPQLQMIWQQVRFDHSQDAAGDVSLGSTRGVTGRLGVNGSWNIETAGGTQWSPYLALNYWHDPRAQSTVTYAGKDRVALDSAAGRVELSAGVKARISESFSIFAAGSYQRSSSGAAHETRDSVSANLGLQYHW